MKKLVREPGRANEKSKLKKSLVQEKNDKGRHGSEGREEDLPGCLSKKVDLNNKEKKLPHTAWRMECDGQKRLISY